MDEDNPVVYGLSLESWLKVAILTPLFVAVYWLVLRWLWDKTNPVYGEANWGHAVCIPAVGCITSTSIAMSCSSNRPVRRGLACFVTLAGLTASPTASGQDRTSSSRAAHGADAFGVVLLLCGWRIMSIAWFPIAFLICGIPLAATGL
jgi:hypothetical protein